MKVGATTSALLSGEGEGFFSEILRPGACFTKLGRSWDERSRAGDWGGGKGEIDDARFSRGKDEFCRDPDRSKQVSE